MTFRVRKLLLATIAILIGISAATYWSSPTLPPPIEIDTRGQPTIGYARAPVHVVIFEEPYCGHCRDFTEEIFPALKKEFIDTGKILYSVIPVSFLPGSMPAAIATLCVQKANPQYPNDALFMAYLETIYRNLPKEKGDWATDAKLSELARKTSPAIDLEKLKSCIDHETYRIQIEKNTDYGTALMGGRIITPTVYVNGIKAEEISLDSLRKLIKEVLEHEGIH